MRPSLMVSKTYSGSRFLVLVIWWITSMTSKSIGIMSSFWAALRSGPARMIGSAVLNDQLRLHNRIQRQNPSSNCDGILGHGVDRPLHGLRLGSSLFEPDTDFSRDFASKVGGGLQRPGNTGGRDFQ